jgi:NhaA family Na+:H+ antiporter
MPQGLDLHGVGVITPLKGIGFTIAIFIAVLAFDSSSQQDEVKLAVLLGSATAAVIGLLGMHARKLAVSRGHGR